jgi:hypothetical protein
MLRMVVVLSTASHLTQHIYARAGLAESRVLLNILLQSFSRSRNCRTEDRYREFGLGGDLWFLCDGPFGSYPLAIIQRCCE